MLDFMLDSLECKLSKAQMMTLDNTIDFLLLVTIRQLWSASQPQTYKLTSMHLLQPSDNYLTVETTSPILSRYALFRIFLFLSFTIALLCPFIVIFSFFYVIT